MEKVREDFVAGLIDTKQVSIRKHDKFPFYILNYTSETFFAKEWNPITSFCRGLILDEKGNIVARSFEKFFNLYETSMTQPEALPSSPFRVERKVDGSLGIIYLGEDDQLYVSTRGAFDSPQAQWATNFLNKASPHDHEVIKSVIRRGITPVVEIVYAENVIQIKYDYEGLVLLALINNSDGRAVEEGDSLVERTSCFLPNKVWSEIDGSIDAVIDFVEHLPDDEEGVVVFFPKENFRVKIKTQHYVQTHKSAFITYEAFALKHLTGNGKDVDLKLVPEADDFIARINQKIEATRKRVTTLFDAAPVGVTRKEFVGWVKSNVDPVYQSHIYRLFDKKPLVEYDLWKC